jgi:hypothetical protein
MVGQDREEANRLQQAKWELTSRIRDESNVPNAFHFSRRSRKRYSAETVPQPVTESGMGGWIVDLLWPRSAQTRNEVRIAQV